MDVMIPFLENADEETLFRVLEQVRKRYAQLHPDWEVCFLSLPKNDPKLREETLAWIAAHDQ